MLNGDDGDGYVRQIRQTCDTFCHNDQIAHKFADSTYSIREKNI